MSNVPGPALPPNRPLVPPSSLSHLLLVSEEPFAEAPRSNLPQARPLPVPQGHDGVHCGAFTLPVPDFSTISNIAPVEVFRVVDVEVQLDPGKLLSLFYQCDDMLMYGGLYRCWGGPVLTREFWDQLPDEKKQLAALNVQMNSSSDKVAVLRSKGLLGPDDALKNVPVKEIQAWFRRDEEPCLRLQAMVLTRHGYDEHLTHHPVPVIDPRAWEQ
ncbi:MAG: hypothetical protein M1823_004246 [Watsoniomyces obsoletus]|nr:MAG: hypothetical protein M1823_004246 [Watsoniomyces obsoletus]